MKEEINMDNIKEIATQLQQSYVENKVDVVNACNLPSLEGAIDIIDNVRNIVFPGYYERCNVPLETKLAALEDLLNDQISKSISSYRCCEVAEEDIERAKELTTKFMNKLVDIRNLLITDAQAHFENDPAAESKTEIIITYPGFYAITVHRIAYELYKLGVPILPRIIAEHAHTITGTDIHPGADIGPYFFIDHATGVVIGETTKIGSHVKIYQGVTLGALTTRGGQKLRGSKRHPTIEDYVVIYAGTTILGGETIIHSNQTIGANEFIVKSR